MKIDNPCIGVCKFDAATGMCVACLRTRDERKTWKTVSESDRSAVIALRPERERALVAAGTALIPAKLKKVKKKDEKKKDGKKDEKKKEKKKTEKKRKNKAKKRKNEKRAKN